MADVIQHYNIDQIKLLIRDIRAECTVAHPKVKNAVKTLLELDHLQTQNVDLSLNLEFQRLFTRFFRVRRNAEWRAKFFGVLATALRSSNPSFECLLAEIYSITGRVEASFVSKGITRINRFQPTIDANVLAIMERYFPETTWQLLRNGSSSEKSKRAISIYCNLGQITNLLLATTEWAEHEHAFDAEHGHTDLSAAKKLDLLLWTYGAGTNNKVTKSII